MHAPRVFIPLSISRPRRTVGTVRTHTYSDEGARTHTARETRSSRAKRPRDRPRTWSSDINLWRSPSVISLSLRAENNLLSPSAFRKRRLSREEHARASVSRVADTDIDIIRAPLGAICRARVKLNRRFRKRRQAGDIGPLENSFLSFRFQYFSAL